MTKKIKVFLLIIVMISVGLTEIKSDINATELEQSELNAKSALLMDADSGRVLYHKNGYEKMPMASTTKIMTCLLTLEKYNENDELEFSNYAASMPKVKLGAPANSRFLVKDLLYSLMLESHNDTAVAIAEKIGGTTIEFANMMNERAKQIGAKNTNFVTPNGLDDEKHYTTAYDLALIAREAIKNQQFVDIINTKEYTFSDLDNRRNYSLTNKDAFLSQMCGAFGIKTGFTGKAGYCFVGALRQNNKTLISVVLASGWPPHKTYKWQDTRKLMNYGLNNFEYRVLFSGVDYYKSLKVKKGKEQSVDTHIDGNLSTLLSDGDNVEYLYDFDETQIIEAPIKENQVVGYLRIMINGEEFTNFKICTKKSVKKIDFSYSFKYVLRHFLYH